LRDGVPLTAISYEYRTFNLLPLLTHSLTRHSVADSDSSPAG